MEKYDKLSREELIRLLMDRDGEDLGGIRMSYPGQRPPWQIVRLVKPRSQRIERKFCYGTETEQTKNLIIEGENLQALVSLYKYRGQVDLILTDPPYNTGQDFRYNDRWDEDPNDPELGRIVPADDGSRHSKWLRFMKPRLWMMKEMLRPDGVIAICIDHRELYRLGLLMDELFGEANRIGIINWQKSYSPRSDNKGMSTATEYVLVYAKQIERSKTALLARTDEMNARYGHWDEDPDEWKSGDASGPNASTHRKMVYAIQSPFTGELFYPPDGSCWRSEKKFVRQWLSEWGTEYEDRWIDDGNEFIDEKTQAKVRVGALVMKGLTFKKGKLVGGSNVLGNARAKAFARKDEGSWPLMYFGMNGDAGPQLKRYLKDVKKGKVPLTYWAADDYDEPLDIESVSWPHVESGHSQAAIAELDAMVGKGHNFKTVKPLKLMKKIIQIWCPPTGIVLDCFAGSGTTAHAVLELNQEAVADRRFILIEQGRPERGDSYARSLTVQRIRRALTGERVSKKGEVAVTAEPLVGGFRFSKLNSAVDAAAVLALEREEMIDLLLTSHWNHNERASSHLQRLPAGTHEHLFAKSRNGEGYFLVWKGPDKPSKLNREAFRAIVNEAEAEGLVQPFHVYARISTYSGPNIEFYQIPNRILEKLGFNEAYSPYGTGSETRSSSDTEAAE
jgi:adenine-specific DNA-methyltransferase